MGKAGKENLQFNTTVIKTEHKDNAKEVTLSDRSKKLYDLIIVADGINSQTSRLLWDLDEYRFYYTSWGGWVAWLGNQKLDIEGVLG